MQIKQLQRRAVTQGYLADSGSGSLRQAITSADDAGGTDVINFANGLHGTIYVASGLPALSANITIDGPGASFLSLAGTGISGFGEIFTVDPTYTTVIENMRITDGYNEWGGAIGDNVDGGLFDLPITLTVKNCIVAGNTGSGIFAPVGSTLTVIDSTISGNTGQGIWAYGVASGGLGWYTGLLTVIDSTVSGNNGGGISGGAGVTIAVVNCTISGNSTSGDGGGINDYGTLDVTDSTISGNSAAKEGGGISSGNGAPLREAVSDTLRIREKIT